MVNMEMLIHAEKALGAYLGLHSGYISTCKCKNPLSQVCIELHFLKILRPQNKYIFRQIKADILSSADLMKQ